jgi:HEAT repeat protein
MTRIALWLAQHQLKSKTPARRLKALQRLRTALNDAVVALDDKITIALLDHVLTDPAVEVRAEATSILGDLRDARTLAPLIRALSDSDEAVQEIAITALKRLDDRAAIAALIPKLSDGTATVQWRAAQTLKSLGWRPQTTAEKIYFHIATGEIWQVSAYGTDAVKPLTELLRAATSEKKVAAANALGEIGDPAVFKPLQTLLRDPEPLVRSAAIYALEQAGCREALPAILNALRDSARNVRLVAVAVLGSLGDVTTVEPLIRLLNDKDWEIRRAALESLGKLGDTRAFPSVAKRLEDTDEGVREVAADALGRVGNETIVEKLVMTLVDAHGGVRQAAARTLAKIYPRWETSERVQKMLPEIQGALRHRDISVQSAAASLLKRVNRPSAAGSTLALTSATDAAPLPIVNLLRELLADADADVRAAAAETVGRMQLADCTEKLKTALHDTNECVKLAAQNALAKLSADEPADGSKVTFLSTTAVPSPAAVSAVEDVLIGSTFGEVWHERNCRQLADWVKTLDFILPQAERLGGLMTLGNFQRLEIHTSGARVLILATTEGRVMLRVKNNSAVVPAPNNAGSTDALKTQATDWLRRAPSVRGALLRGLRFTDQTIVCDVDARDLTAVALEQSFRAVADTFQWLLPRQLPSAQLIWHYDRTVLHCVRRADKTILGAMATAKSDDLDLSGLNRQLAEFQNLAAV